MTRWLAAVLALLLVAGCSSIPGSGNPTSDSSQYQADATTKPPEGAEAVDSAAEKLALALHQLDIVDIAMQSPSADAQEDLKKIFAGMDDIAPDVTVGAIHYGEGRKAKVNLHFSLPVGIEPWQYKTTATFSWVDQQWRLNWSPKVIHPDLLDQTRLRRVIEEPHRAPIVDKDGVALAEEISMYDVGLDKAHLNQSKWSTSARQLAAAVGQDPKEFEKKVLAGGTKQFVVATRLRQQDIPDSILKIEGIYVQETKSTVGISEGFATSLLGSVGEPTAEMVKKSRGKLHGRKAVGLTGLQARYDDQLAGVPRVRVEIVSRDPNIRREPQVVFHQEPSVGSPLQLSLDRRLQEKAENILKSTKEIASFVVIDNSSGGIVVAANSPAASNYPHATFGQYAPGSTFKIISALALIRKGKSATTPVDCPASETIDGYTFKNYSGFSHSGRVTLEDAIAYSCNTTFIKESRNISLEELQTAAFSLGVGKDYDAGFASFFGQIKASTPVEKAADMIGQGQVLMSPMAMASVARSVKTGKTTIPWLVKNHEAQPSAARLTEGEVRELQKMMQAVVQRGTGQILKGIVQGAKSGTAQFGSKGKIETHAWMIAYNDAYSIAAFVKKGASGSETAAPLIKKFLAAN